MRLHLKLLVILVPLIAAPLVVLGLLGYAQQRDRVEVESMGQLGVLVEQVNRQIQARLAAARADVVLFASSHLRRRYMLVDDESQRYQLLQPTMLRQFASYQRANPEYDEFRIVLPDGYVDTLYATSTAPDATEDGAPEGHVRSAFRSEDEVLVQIPSPPDLRRPAAVISHRLAFLDPSIDPILAKPRLRGYLFIRMRLDFLQEQADKVRMGERGHLFFTDSKGRILTSPARIEHPHAVHRPIAEEIIESARSAKLVQAPHLGEASLILLWDLAYILAVTMLLLVWARRGIRQRLTN